METQTIKHRPQQEPSASTSPKAKPNKASLAKRGLKSLTIATAAPLLLTAITAYLLTPTSSLSPPMWALHFLSLSSSLLMGFSSWLVWAAGGFRHDPAALGLYAAELMLGLLWAPLVLGAGAVKSGLLMCGGLVLVLFGCLRAFKRSSALAGDLVKPCLAWACFLAIFNYRLLKG